MIEIKNLSKTFGSFKALDDLCITVQEGSVYGLLGPNGAGKTTLIKQMAGVLRQDAGSIAFNGQPVFENPEAKASIVYIADDPFFFSQYSVDETAKLYASLYPTWSWERYELLKQVFPIDSKRRVIRMSKGMQKQVAFWLGISIMPQFMLLDEPVDGLDPVMRRKVWNLILQDVAERQMTVLVSSHNLRELEDICDHVGILHNGKIVVERELDNLKSDIHKVQVAFSEDAPEDFLENLEVLNHSRNGNVHLLIAKGDKEKLLAELQKANPVILDLLPLTLEEIFIFELGGMGYDIQNILI